MGKAADIVRLIGIAACLAALLATAGCRAKRESVAVAETTYNSQKILEHSLSDTKSLIIDIAFDSVEISFVNPAPTPSALSNAKIEAALSPSARSNAEAARVGTKAYGIRATLRSERVSGAETSAAETVSATSAEQSRSEVSGSVNLIGKWLIWAAGIIFSAMLIIIYRKKEKTAKK